MKRCTRCNKEKDESYFYLDCRGSVKKPRGCCKDCHKLSSESARAKRKVAKKVVPTTKECKFCNIVKKVDLFSPCHYSLDGLTSYCKVCNTIFMRDWESRNKDKLAGYCKKWIDKNKEYVLLRSRNYESREEVKKLRIAYRRSDIGMERSRLNVQKRNSRIRNLPYTLTLDEWNDILMSQDNKCLGCKREFDDKFKPEQDHIIPVSKGGGYVKENIQALCRSCNSSKGNRIISFEPFYGVKK